MNPDPTKSLVACKDGCGRLYAPVARSMHYRVFHSADGDHPVIEPDDPSGLPPLRGESPNNPFHLD